ncbi:diguanylate cyclase domain-containing protein [Nitrincola sp.]|uniref:diguanylate cyclase domain-containing protein n=1 Tax=Nitrincola sp. TaxID=1926584 RepID=UPI003A8E8617
MSSTPTPRLLRMIIAPVLGLLVTVVFFAMSGLYQGTLHQQQKALDIERLAEVRANIEGAFNGATNLTAGLIAFVSANGEISEEFFTRLSKQLLEQNHLIRHITLAPDNIIRYVYPLEGNEVALGLDLLHHPEQGLTTKIMMETAEPVLAGPYELEQGDIAVIHRVPIYLRNSEDEKYYWGLMSTPINFSVLLEASGILNPSFDLNIALRSLEGTGADGVVFYGDEALFEHREAIRSSIKVLNGTWEMAAVSDRPHSNPVSGLIWIARTIGATFGLLTTFMVWQLMRMTERLRASQAQYRMLAQHDSLTGLPNRVVLYDRFDQAVARAERNQDTLVLLYMDLDGFKEINDLHGHQAGDMTLTELAKRFRSIVRGTDSVIRIGGDEFIVLLENVASIDSVLAVTDKILQCVATPIRFESLEFSLGISIGIACFPNNGLTLDQLMTAGDHAMYAAKATGKNRISWASDPSQLF